MKIFTLNLTKCSEKCPSYAYIFPGDVSGCNKTGEILRPDEFVKGFPKNCPLDNK